MSLPSMHVKLFQRCDFLFFSLIFCVFITQTAEIRFCPAPQPPPQLNWVKSCLLLQLINDIQVSGGQSTRNNAANRKGSLPRLTYVKNKISAKFRPEKVKSYLYEIIIGSQCLIEYLTILIFSSSRFVSFCF